MDARRLTDEEKLTLSRAGAPWLRWGLDLPAAQAWQDPDARALAVVRTRHPYGTTLAAVGDPVVAVALAAELAPGLDLTSVTLPCPSVVPPGPVFGPLPAGVGWEWMWTSSAPPRVRGEERVHELDVSDPVELTEFLAEHSPRHSAEPDDDGVRVWLGVRGEHGELLACVAIYAELPGVDLMASVCVAAAARGQGLGLAVTAAATRRALAERPPVATVDLYSDNAAARALYTRLGYRLDQAFTSYRLA